MAARNRINFIPKRQTLSNIDITTATNTTYFRKIWKGNANETAVRLRDIDNVNFSQCVFLDYTSDAGQGGRALFLGGISTTRRTVTDLVIDRCQFIRCNVAIELGFADCTNVNINESVCLDTAGYLFNGVAGNWRGQFILCNNIDVTTGSLVTINQTKFWNRTGQNSDINGLVSCNLLIADSGWIEVRNGWFKQESGASYLFQNFGGALGTLTDTNGKRQRYINNRGENASAFGLQLDYNLSASEVEIQNNYILIQTRNTANGTSGSGLQIEVWDDATINTLLGNIINAFRFDGVYNATFFDTTKPSYTSAKAAQVRQNNNFQQGKLTAGLLPENLIL